jgi:hypothetical protein
MKHDLTWYEDVALSALTWVDGDAELGGKLSPEFVDSLLAIGFQSRHAAMALDEVYSMVGEPDLAEGSLEAGMVVYFYPFSLESQELDHAIVFHVADGKVIDFGTDGREARMIDPSGSDRSPEGLLTLAQHCRPFPGSPFDRRKA